MYLRQCKIGMKTDRLLENTLEEHLEDDGWIGKDGLDDDRFLADG